MDLYVPEADKKGGLLKIIQDSLKKPNFYAASAGLLLLILVPYFHLGVLYTAWNTNKTPVDKSVCECSCWDTLFKGSYERSDHPKYKHIYFNLTHQTFKIWTLSAIAFIIFYETAKYIFILVTTKQARWSMIILLGSVVYPHYYGWWMYFNAWNDDFYKQWYHQAFFSFTELASTIVVLYYCDKRRMIQPRLLLFVIDIALLHILASGGDQFISNVIFQQGAWYQYSRDIGFMVPDLMHIAIPLIEVIRLKLQQKASCRDIFSRFDIICSLVGILFLWYLISTL